MNHPGPALLLPQRQEIRVSCDGFTLEGLVQSAVVDHEGLNQHHNEGHPLEPFKEPFEAVQNPAVSGPRRLSGPSVVTKTLIKVAGEEKKKYRKKQGKEKRRQNRGSNVISRPYHVPPRLQSKHVHSSSPLESGYHLEGSKVTKSGYIAHDRAIHSKKVLSIDELVNDHGIKVVHWDGTPTSLTDDNGRIFVILAGAPYDPKWDNVHQDAFEAMEGARQRLVLSQKQTKHRRGEFGALSCGPSYGGGQTRPGNLVNSEANTPVLDQLLQAPSIQRLAGFASGVFSHWAPRLYSHYLDNLNALCRHYPDFRCNFKNSVWTTATFNFGPKTVCFPHRDVGNLPYGFCAITALGRYDSIMSGHLVLWDLKLAIEFPPGCTILIPSATLLHSNASVQEGDVRMSFTQYTPGGLFRWVDHGFRTDKQFKTEDPQGKESFDENSVNRWKDGLSLLSTLDEFIKPVT